MINERPHDPSIANNVAARVAEGVTYQSDPIRRKKILHDLKIGIFTTAAAGVAFAFANGVLTNSSNEKLLGKLSHPHGQVEAELRAGEIDPNKVVTVTAPTTEYAAQLAESIVSNGADVTDLTSVITAQENAPKPDAGVVIGGDQFIVPAGDVAANAVTPAVSGAK